MEVEGVLWQYFLINIDQFYEVRFWDVKFGLEFLCVVDGVVLVKGDEVKIKGDVFLFDIVLKLLLILKDNYLDIFFLFVLW